MQKRGGAEKVLCWHKGLLSGREAFGVLTGGLSRLFFLGLFHFIAKLSYL